MDNNNKNNKTNSIGEQKAELIKEISQDILEDLKKIPRDRVGLVVIKGPGIGEKFFIDKQVLSIGRNTDSDILLDDITVSRKHAVIEKNNDKFVLVDLGSLNGSYVNSEIVNSRELRNGDKIQIGKYVFMFFSSI
ncbi:MAG: FHA domain-containing protein [Actinobacteria bacterium]|nr:FHA domain-containing protein [Actinomycetota bacterium]